MTYLLRNCAILLSVLCSLACVFPADACIVIDGKGSAPQKPAVELKQQTEQPSDKKVTTPKSRKKETQGRVVSDAIIPPDPKSGATPVSYPCVYKRGTCLYHVF